MRTSLRTLFAASVAGTVVLAGGAVAAPPKPNCNLVKDASGDAEIVTSQPGMDIVSGDIATGAKNLTAVLRMDGAPSGGNPQAAGGSRYYFAFSVPGATNPQYVSAIVPLVGAPSFRSGEVVTSSTGTSTYTNDPAGDVTGEIKGKEITINAPLSAFASRAKIKPGTKISGLTIETFALVGVFLVPVDDAAGKNYVAGSRSCIKTS